VFEPIETRSRSFLLKTGAKYRHRYFAPVLSEIVLALSFPLL
jgi:hypothetical protein